MTDAPPPPEARRLRSQDWFGQPGKDGFIHRSWMRRGLPDEAFDGSKPIIGICTSWSDLAPCNAHLDDVADHVSRGIWEAGGVPVVFPVLSLGETNIRPTAMLLRNLMAMAVEESIRANPIDGVVCLAGCDKTTAAMWLGAASVDLPTVIMTGGPMLTGRFKGQRLGSGTDVWRFSEEVRAGTMSQEDFHAAEACMTRSAGHCNVMGTASTLACLTEAMGLALPGSAAIPAADARHRTMAHDVGRRAVALVAEDLKPSDIVTAASLRNAAVANAAIGGSTNAVVHLLALAGRLEVDFDLDAIDTAGRGVPLLVDLAPAGEHYMEDFFEAGGMPVLLDNLGALVDRDQRSVTGDTIGAGMVPAEPWSHPVIRAVDDPVKRDAAIAVLRGNLVPGGAVIKPAAATAGLLEHTGRAVVFDSIEDFHARIDDEDLDVEPGDVLVLRGCGPKGYPGMPEVGNMAIPAKLLARGIRDMVRVSDARMSGTAFGTVVLHAAPEAAAGGPLAVVRDGDTITLDVPSRTLHLHVSDDELAERLAAWQPPEPTHDRGWYKLYVDTVTQADTGADLSFLRGKSTFRITRESH